MLCSGWDTPYKGCNSLCNGCDALYISTFMPCSGTLGACTGWDGHRYYAGGCGAAGPTSSGIPFGSNFTSLKA